MNRVTHPGPPAPARAGRREWIGLAVLALPLLLVSMDVSVLYFAVPFISADLHATATQQLWIFDVYGFVLAGLLITMGSLADRIGRRRLLILGALAFGAASAAAAWAPDAGLLIAARAVLGVGGATLMPSTLALIRSMFADQAQRRTAIAVWSAILMGGISLGPVLSGFLLEHFWWGSVFLINTPAMVALVLLAPLLLPESKDPRGGRFDLLGSLLSLGAVLPVVYGIKHWAVDGLDLVAAGPALAGLVLGVLFVLRQRRAAHPMIDLELLHEPAFSGGLVAASIAMFVLVGNAVFMTQYLQLVLGMSPMRAALWSLAPSVVVAGAAPLAQFLATRVRTSTVLAGGFTLGAAGFGVLTRVHPDSHLVLLLAGATLLAAGLVAVATLVTEIVVGSGAAERTGSASALMETASELGGALGIAVLGSIGAAVFRSAITGQLPAGLPPSAVAAVQDGLPGAVAAARALPPAPAGALLAAARDAFSSGLHVVSVVGAAVLLAAALGVALTIRRSGLDVPRGRSQPDAAPAPQPVTL